MHFLFPYNNLSIVQDSEGGQHVQRTLAITLYNCHMELLALLLKKSLAKTNTGPFLYSESQMQAFHHQRNPFLNEKQWKH